MFKWVGSKKHFQTHSEPKQPQTFPLQSLYSNMCLCKQATPTDKLEESLRRKRLVHVNVEDIGPNMGLVGDSRDSDCNL